MRLSPLKIYTIKVLVFGIILLYLAIDLLAWHGPVWHAVYSSDILPDRSNVVATVFGEDITEAQLARHTAEQDKLAGRQEADAARRASRLMELVRAAELRVRTRYNDLNLPECKQEAVAEVARLASRAQSDANFDQWLADQGYTRGRFTDKVEARLREQAQLERAIAPFCKVTDADVAEHYEQLKGQLIQPATRPVRHIFLATLKRDKAEVQARAAALLQKLQEGADFAELACSNSEDERSARRGGDLGILADDGQTPLPELPLFGEKAIPANTPVLVESAWGWHIMSAGEISPARPLTLEECRESLRTALISAQRELAAQAYFNSALKEGRHSKHIQIHVP